MFKRHSIQVRVVKDTDQPEADTKTKPRLSDEEVTIVKEMAKGTVKAIIFVMAASVVLNTVSQLLIIAAESGNTEEEED